MENERDRILNEITHELMLPRPNALKDDKEFWKEMRHKIGGLLIEAEALGKTDFDYITALLPIPRGQARDIIKSKRAYDFVEQNCLPMMKRWDEAFNELRDESHRLDAIGQSGNPSELWSDLMNEIMKLSIDIDRKTVHIRDLFPSYVEKTRANVVGSIKLAYPNDPKMVTEAEQFFNRLRR